MVASFNISGRFTAKFELLFVLTLFRMVLFGAAHGWRGGGAKRFPPNKICHIYPTMMKLDTLIAYLKKIEKNIYIT